MSSVEYFLPNPEMFSCVVPLPEQSANQLLEPGDVFGSKVGVLTLEFEGQIEPLDVICQSIIPICHLNGDGWSWRPNVPSDGDDCVDHLADLAAVPSFVLVLLSDFESMSGLVVDSFALEFLPHGDSEDPLMLIQVVTRLQLFLAITNLEVQSRGSASSTVWGGASSGCMDSEQVYWVEVGFRELPIRAELAYVIGLGDLASIRKLKLHQLAIVDQVANRD
ncbi:hypothetical protein BDZ91DRAFT_768696 [Kalaharituber pfeilii]|nr:hypothetical protein BDZ91DRAFT_768696 [Kalaharituber pfeilii]